MIFIIVVLTAVSVMFEWQLVKKLAIFRWFFADKTRAIVGSLILSALAGKVFGAAGVMVFVAGLASTFVIQPLYAADKAGHIDKAHAKYNDTKTRVVNNKNEIVFRYNQLKAVFLIVTKPIVLLFKAIFWTLDRLGVQG